MLKNYCNFEKGKRKKKYFRTNYNKLYEKNFRNFKNTFCIYIYICNTHVYKYIFICACVCSKQTYKFKLP